MSQPSHQRDSGDDGLSSRDLNLEVEARADVQGIPSADEDPVPADICRKALDEGGYVWTLKLYEQADRFSRTLSLLAHASIISHEGPGRKPGLCGNLAIVAKTFGLFLVESGVLTRKLLFDALRLQRESGCLLGSCLLELGYIKRGQLLQSLSSFLGVPPAPPSMVLNPDHAVAGLFDRALLHRLRAVPYELVRENVFVAFADPRFLEAVRKLESRERGERIVPRIAVEPDVEAALQTLFGAGQALETEPEDVGPDRVPLVIAAAGRSIDIGALSRKDAERSSERAITERSTPPLEQESPQAGSTPSIGNEDEVAFARDTGFDRQRTAIFRLDDLAAEHAAKREVVEAEGKPSNAEEGLSIPERASDFAEVVDEIHEAPDEAAIAKLVVDYFAEFFPRVILLSRRDDVLEAIHTAGLDESSESLRAPAESFSRLFEEGIGYYGPPPGGKELEPLYEALGAVAVNALLLPIDCWCEPAWMIYADHGEDLRMYDDVHELEMMAREVALALGVRRGV